MYVAYHHRSKQKSPQDRIDELSQTPLEPHALMTRSYQAAEHGYLGEGQGSEDCAAYLEVYCRNEFSSFGS